VNYPEFRFLFPPRPKSALPEGLIHLYEGRGWLGSYKKNGTCCLIGIGPDNQIIGMNRHEELLEWSMPGVCVDTLRNIFGAETWTVLVAELIHHKVKDMRNILYIFDVLVWKGEYLVGSTFLDRHMTMLETFRPFILEEEYSHWVGPGGVWLSKILFYGLRSAFDSIQHQELDEGIVIKDPNGKLSECRTDKANSHWQVKVRHPKENYIF